MYAFKIGGPVFRGGAPFHLIVSAFDDFQSVVDKSYLVMTNSKRMMPRDRELFQLKATKFHRGSLITHFEIVLAGVQLSLPLVSTLGPNNLWEYTKDAFMFLKLVCSSVQRGVKPTYDFDNDGDVTVHTGDTHHHYHGPVFQIAKLSLPSYQRLAHTIDPKKVDHISAGREAQPDPDIYIGPEGKDLFDVPTRIEKETIKLRCEIFDFNKYKNMGRLAVNIPSQAIPVGEYSFQIFGSQDNVDYIYSMLKPEVELHCLVEMEMSPFGDDKVHKLHITGVSP